MAALSMFAAVVLVLGSCVESKFMVYNTSAKIVPDKINVHLVPHTHDDAGWLKTVDQYYVGSNTPFRKFIYVEQAFFERWWREQSEAIKDIVKDLVKSGQLEFINGGMVMHDEAVTHYIDMIDQTTLGHRFLKKEFGVTPRIGWQIDPFGHSAVQAYLLGAEVGFDSLYFARIDYQDREKRMDEKTLEVVWQGSKSKCHTDKYIMWTMGTDSSINMLIMVPADGQADSLCQPDAKYATQESWPTKLMTSSLTQIELMDTGLGTLLVEPTLKRYAARQLEYFLGRSKSGPNNDALADALAIAQHHDAVTGTEKQHVANDYAKRLSIGYQECPLLNISYCPASETDLSHGKNLILVVYNPLGWKREDIIRIPVKNEEVVVHDYEGREIESQVLPISDVQLSISKFHVASYLGITVREAPKYWLAFKASVPPLGFSTYTVSGVKGAKLTRSSVITYKGNKMFPFDIGSETLKLALSEKNGKLTYHNKQRNLGKKSVELLYGFYPGYNGTHKDPQASGAYVFRPNGTFVMQSKRKVQSTVMRGPLIDEVHQQINSWIHQVGPIPVEDGIGKEVVAKMSTGMLSNKTFYTDSNGHWDLKVNQPVAGNYYPINLGMYLHDDTNEFSVLVDRAVAGSSILDGQMELMLHRRLLKDDGKGVAEALNETVCAHDKCIGLIAQGRFYFKTDRLGEGAKWRRSFGQQIYSPLLLAFSEQQDGDSWLDSHVPKFSGMDSSYSLPENVAMITLQELDDGKVLLRLAHLYEVGEDKDLSSMANVELKRIFPSKKTGVEVSRLSSSCIQSDKGGPVDPTKLVVELSPMEIRTFVIEFSHKSDLIFDA
ncbi:hypothetical protein RDABS01_033813 [Bienertia sinuspersici]